MDFVGLHIHSDYSLLDGASQLDALVDKAKELGMEAIALTDHGVMYGAVELIKICRNKNVKPIIGNEMYVINGDIEEKKRCKKYHQVVLAKNTQGYKNLVKLTTISHLKGMQGKGIFARPCINKELLKQYHEGLIVTSACLGGEIPQAIMKGRLDIARQVAQWYKDVFGDDYYLEIQDHGSVEDRVVNVEIVKIAQELGIKIVATNDSHFISCYDVEAHDALLCIQTGKLIVEDNRMRYSGTEYLKSAKEMAKLFRDHLPDDVIKEAIANTVEVADKVKPYDIFDEPRLPDYPVPPDHTADTYVEKIAKDGLQERFNTKSYTELDPIYRERLEYELKMLQRMGFSTYFLVVWDYIKYARDNNIPVGPGRGSAAGSLVAYALRITNIDPVHHGLLFERFLNPERKSMPDIDTDFCIERRDDVIKYVTEKYGTERVAQIITFNRLTSKSVLKDVARVLNIPYSDSDKMAKLIPVVRGKPTKLKVMISQDTPAPEFKEKYENDEVKIIKPDGSESIVKVRDWVDMAMRIEGTNKTFGVHAAGVVISAQPLDEIVPLQKNNDGSVITQYFMEDLESLGLLKMDFLGLRNLTIIQNTINLIEQSQGYSINPDDIIAEERKSHKILSKGDVKKRIKNVDTTYKLLEAGDLEGIFQLESSGMLDVVAKLKPSSIEDISSILALYRPGPLDAGLIPKFIDRKHGREDIKYEHPALEPILQETYAVLVYQEQIMKIAQDLAGYSLGQADLLRRAMGKKKASEMQKQRETFLEGAAKNGVQSKIAEDLFEQMVKFAEYCFNKSHSTAYAYVTYQTAFLKANYKVEYMAALLTANSGDQDKVAKYLNNCEKTLGIKIEPPDINRSEVNFTPSNGNILFGLSAVKSVGEGAIQAILTARKEGVFKSLADLCERVSLSTVKTSTLEALIKCGAFDKINKNRQQLIDDLKLIIPWAQGRAKDKEIGQGNLFDLFGLSTTDNGFESAPTAKPIEDFSQKEKLQFEQELLGFYVSEHPLKDAINIAKSRGITPINLSELGQNLRNKNLNVVVILAEIKQVVTKKDNRPMAILKLSDIEGQQAPAVVFSDTYEKIKDLLVANTPLLLKGKASKRDEEIQLIVEEAKSIDELVKEPSQNPHPSMNEFESEFETDYFVMIQIAPQRVENKEYIEKLQAILKESSGEQLTAKVPVLGMVINQDTRRFVRFGNQFWVQDKEGALERLKTAGFMAELKTNKVIAVSNF